MSTIDNKTLWSI